MPKGRPSQDVRPLSEFRANVATFVEQVQVTGRPLVLTQHGRSAAILLAVEAYEALIERAELAEDVRTAEAQIATRQGIPHGKALALVRARLRVPARSRQRSAWSALGSWLLSMRIVWSPLALVRVEEIARVIAADRPAAAERWVRTVFARAAQLRTYPESGRIVSELERPELRQLLHPPYRIIYRVDAKQVTVLTIRHGRQELNPEEVGVDAP
jgi:toxin ParE1/3/4